VIDLLADKRSAVDFRYRFYTCRYKRGSDIRERLGRSLLELGGNNAIIITEKQIRYWHCMPVLFWPRE